MLKFLAVIAVVFILVLLAEYWYRIKHYQTEFTRKFVHITVGTFVAFWPWFLSWNQIEILSVLFFMVIIGSRLLSIFSSIHLIGRKTMGELFFAIAIGLTALIARDRFIFMTAMLHLSLADGFAAIAGTYYGKPTRYRIFQQLKSVVGSEVFYLVSFLLIVIYFAISHRSGVIPTILWLPFATTLFENVGIGGSDNVLVPLIVALSLRVI